YKIMHCTSSSSQFTAACISDQVVQGLCHNLDIRLQILCFLVCHYMRKRCFIIVNIQLTLSGLEAIAYGRNAPLYEAEGITNLDYLLPIVDTNTIPNTHVIYERVKRL